MIRGYTAYLLRRFRKELPWLIAIWALAAIVGALLGIISGELSPRESLALALAFMPLLVPLAPLWWLRSEWKAHTPKALPAIGLGCAWFVLTLPLAVGAAALIGHLLHVE